MNDKIFTVRMCSLFGGLFAITFGVLMMTAFKDMIMVTSRVGAIFGVLGVFFMAILWAETSQ